MVKKAKTQVGALQEQVPFYRNPDNLVGQLITGVGTDYNSLILVLNGTHYFCVQLEDYGETGSLIFNGIVTAAQLARLGLIDKEALDKAIAADNRARNKENKKVEDENLKTFVKARADKIRKILTELDESA